MYVYINKCEYFCVFLNGNIKMAHINRKHSYA